MSGTSVVEDGSTLITARSVPLSLPTSVPFADLPFWNLTVIERGAADDVVVRDDVALAVEHEARSLGLARLRLRGAEERVAVAGAARRDDDVDDTGRRALVQVDERRALRRS